MATERTTRNQRRLLVGLLVMTMSLAAILGIAALHAGGDGKTGRAGAARPTTVPSVPSETVSSAPDRVTATTEAPSAVATATTEAPVAVDTSTVAASGDDPQPTIGSTEACRADPACPSSEHRTSDLCGATLIVDQAGYLEGRRDAEQGLPYQIDGAPAPSPADDDDDDATVGPQTAYRAGYVQGWCDGGGEQPASP